MIISVPNKTRIRLPDGTVKRVDAAGHVEVPGHLHKWVESKGFEPVEEDTD